MQIKLNKSKTTWVEIGEGFKVKVDYPSVEQSDNLQTLLFNFADEDTGKLKIGDADFLNFQKTYLKYVIKDWEGLKDEKDNDIFCGLRELRNGDTELSSKSYGLLADIKNVWLISLIYTKVEPELRFIETDKKKFELLVTSGGMVSS